MLGSGLMGSGKGMGESQMAVGGLGEVVRGGSVCPGDELGLTPRRSGSRG